MSQKFTDQDVPDQSGRTFFITGANTGLGLETAQVLAGRGARVLMGCRSMDKASAARQSILEANPGADVDIIGIDLGDLASIHRAADQVGKEPRLDVLINNAGVMMPPRQLTKDGFESQFGVNHLGHFALTAALLTKLAESPDARIVNLSSNGHKMGDIDFDDPHAERSYSAMWRYGMSKLANLLHMYELDRRLRAAGSSTIAVAAHPGGADTDLFRHVGMSKLLRPILKPFLNSARQGTFPSLLAATGADVKGGEYFGPGGLGQFAGPARKVDSNAKSKDPDRARRLWDLSVELTHTDPGLKPV